MTIDIDAIRKRLDAASPGPWDHGNDGLVWPPRMGDPVSGSTELADAEFIAHARTDIPALLAKVGELKGELKRAREALAEDGDLVDQTAAARDRFRRERDAEREAKDRLRAELDRVRADLAAAHNHAHRQDTNLQQIARAKDETAAERDALKAAAEPLLEHIDLIRAHWAVLLPRDVGETLLARGAALAALLPNTQEPCDICSGYGCPDCREDLAGVA